MLENLRNFFNKYNRDVLKSTQKIIIFLTKSELFNNRTRILAELRKGYNCKNVTFNRNETQNIGVYGDFGAWKSLQKKTLRVKHRIQLNFLKVGKRTHLRHFHWGHISDF